jgi:hypothetical protein
MPKPHIHFALIALAFLVSLNLLAPSPVCAQEAAAAPPSPVGTLTYGNNRLQTLRADAYPDHVDFEPVAIHPDQVLQINLQFPPAFARKTIFVAADYGGVVTTLANSDGFIIGNDGRISINFRAPHDPGRCPVQFRFGSSNSVLPLWVMDPVQLGKKLRSQRAD